MSLTWPLHPQSGCVMAPWIIQDEENWVCLFLPFWGTTWSDSCPNVQWRQEGHHQRDHRCSSGLFLSLNRPIFWGCCQSRGSQQPCWLAAPSSSVVQRLTQRARAAPRREQQLKEQPMQPVKYEPGIGMGCSMHGHSSLYLYDIDVCSQLIFSVN